MMGEKITVREIIGLKGKRKIMMLTAYDYPLASIVDRAGIDIILVGDSLANVVLGLESTTMVGMSEMLYHSKAVRRAVKNALLVGDMPYESYQLHPEESLKNARRFIEEAGCDAVKLEWFEHCLQVTRQIVSSGIAVMGHIGLTPQSADKIGGFKVQGKDADTAKQLLEQAVALEEAGCFCLVLECIPDRLAQLVTQALKIPTIGIGAGPYCDGQVLVTHDLLGLFARYTPKFVKRYLQATEIFLRAIEEFKKDVREQRFPDREHSFSIKEEELRKLVK